MEHLEITAVNLSNSPWIFHETEHIFSQPRAHTELSTDIVHSSTDWQSKKHSQWRREEEKEAATGAWDRRGGWAKVELFFYRK